MRFAATSNGFAERARLPPPTGGGHGYGDAVLIAERFDVDLVDEVSRKWLVRRRE